jgi:hypothetical protein
MARKGGPHYEEAWRSAAKKCHLSARQVEMARSLGMNPKKLPRLRPGPQQSWKLPVGEFIEECYRKRFGNDPCVRQTDKPEPTPSKLPTAQADVDAFRPIRDAGWQMEDLVCYLMNLADDLQGWLVHGLVVPEVLPKVIQELREVAEALETGASVSPIPAIPQPPRRGRRAVPRRGNREYQSDDEIPF